MKLYKRCLCVLFAFVLLFGVSSISVSAETLSDFLIYYGWTSPTLEVQESLSGQPDIFYWNTNFSTTYTTWLNPYIIIRNSDGSNIVQADKETHVNISNVTITFIDSSYNTYYPSDFFSKLVLIYTDGTYGYVPNELIEHDYNSNYAVHNFSCSFNSGKPIKEIKLEIDIDPYSTYGKLMTIKQFNLGGAPSGVTVDIQSEEAGLLGYIKGGISDIFGAMTNVYDIVVNLPMNIWGYISDGLTSLFVPDATYIESYGTRFQELLDTRMGALSEVGDILVNSWDNIQTADSQNVIELPEISINVGSDTDFTFGGYEVPIVPSGFEFLADICKTVVAIVSTVLFVNGLLRRYDEVMGVET